MKSSASRTTYQLSVKKESEGSFDGWSLMQSQKIKGALVAVL
jgi:hypothetical protein